MQECMSGVRYYRPPLPKPPPQQQADLVQHSTCVCVVGGAPSGEGAASGLNLPVALIGVRVETTGTPQAADRCVWFNAANIWRWTRYNSVPGNAKYCCCNVVI